MDSGGSGSLQSSSGGDDQEYDSAAVSSLFASISNPNPNPIQPPATASSFFHPSPQHPFSAPNPVLYNNMDPVWSRTPDPNFNHSLLTTPPINQSLLLASYNAAEAARVVPPPQQQQGQGVAPAKNKNPKKRTRASRRAPTTVLTTDTSNFRQMVQEFTGIPAAPFSVPFTRRLDLFGGGGPSAPSDPDHLFAKQPQSLLNLQNPLFTFQSLLQQQQQQQQQQQPLPNSSANNSVADGQRVHTSLGGLPTWGDHHGGEDENFGDFEGNNENSQNGKGGIN